MRRSLVRAVTTLAMCGGLAAPAAAQSSVSDVLSFLLTNRSVQTADFQQDERAAAATRVLGEFIIL